MMAARKQPPTVRQASEFGVDGAHAVELVQLTVPEVQGNCQMIEGATAAEQASNLLGRLREAGVL
jgi:hypothetical protein